LVRQGVNAIVILNEVVRLDGGGSADDRVTVAGAVKVRVRSAENEGSAEVGIAKAGRRGAAESQVKTPFDRLVLEIRPAEIEVVGGRGDVVVEDVARDRDFRDALLVVDGAVEDLEISTGQGEVAGDSRRRGRRSGRVANRRSVVVERVGMVRVDEVRPFKVV